MPLESFFAGPGLDRADPLRAQPEEIARLAAAPDALALMWDHGAPALDDHGRLIWQPVVGDEPLFLGFTPDRAPRFSVVPEGPVPTDLRSHYALLGNLDSIQAPIFAAALSLANWHRRHLFCSVCGHPTTPNRGGWSRQCSDCEAEHYPRVDPVVIMLATHDGRVLLGRQPRYPPRRFSALAGFVEPGETIEAAVARELFEEAGIAVTNVAYLVSQPWPFPSTLMIGAMAEAIDDALTIDRTELDDARWFTRAEVAASFAGDEDATFLAPPHYAVARNLLDHWFATA